MIALLSTVAILAATGITTQAAELYEAMRTDSDPDLDLNAAAWKDVPALKLDSPEKISFKAISGPSQLAIMLQWSCESESRAHSPWKWDQALECYRPGDETEDAFTIRWFKSVSSASPSEAWVWRAGRTDPARRADLLITGPDGILRFDAASSCWTQKAPDSFAGETIPRFVQRPPSGKAAGLHAKGEWLDGVWTLVFSCDKPPFPGETHLLRIKAHAPESASESLDGYVAVSLKVPPGDGKQK